MCIRDRYLAQELAELGLEGAHMDDNGYVYALLPATPGCQAPALGLIAHMDTSPAVSGADIHPEIVTYQGGDLPLKKAGSLKVKDFPFLERYIGQEPVSYTHLMYPPPGRDTNLLRERMGRVDGAVMERVDDAIAVSFGLPRSRLV